MLKMPNSVKLIEVGPRDGLQNENIILSTENKINFINQLIYAGFKNIEIGSFVSATAIPQLQDTASVFANIDKSKEVNLIALVPNLYGFEKAINANMNSIAIFMSASETFSQKNINCSIKDSISEYQAVIASAKQQNMSVRGYLSCVFNCPYEGIIPNEKITQYVTMLDQLGCDEIVLGDTTGMGDPNRLNKLLQQIAITTELNKIALHLHNNNGLALVNIYTALQHNIKAFDCSIAGLGGCPIAKNTTGNVASEDLIYLLNSLHIHSGVNLPHLLEYSKKICKILQRNNSSFISANKINYNL